jgi:hypothetical protein
MPHLKGLSSNPYPVPIKSIPSTDDYFLKIHSNIVLPYTPSLPERLFLVSLTLKIWKALLLSSNLATCPPYFILLNVIVLIILGEHH